VVLMCKLQDHIKPIEDIIVSWIHQFRIRITQIID